MKRLHLFALLLYSNSHWLDYTMKQAVRQPKTKPAHRVSDKVGTWHQENSITSASKIKKTEFAFLVLEYESLFEFFVSSCCNLKLKEDRGVTIGV